MPIAIGPNKRLNIAVVNFWPGFSFDTDPRFCWLHDHFLINITDLSNADLALTSVFTPAMRWQEVVETAHKLPTILYTAEHELPALPGRGQLYEGFYAVISHYRSPEPNHIWVPNSVGRWGWQLGSTVNKLYTRNSRIAKKNKALFVYSSGICPYRAELSLLLKNEDWFVSAGGFMNNQGGKAAPRDQQAFFAYASNFRYYFALENAIGVDYMTEKIFTGLSSGAHVLYRGDPLVYKCVDTFFYTDINNFSPRETKDYLCSLLAAPRENEAISPDGGSHRPCHATLDHELSLSKAEILSHLDRFAN